MKKLNISGNLRVAPNAKKRENTIWLNYHIDIIKDKMLLNFRTTKNYKTLAQNDNSYRKRISIFNTKGNIYRSIQSDILETVLSCYQNTVKTRIKRIRIWMHKRSMKLAKIILYHLNIIDYIKNNYSMTYTFMMVLRRLNMHRKINLDMTTLLSICRLFFPATANLKTRTMKACYLDNVNNIESVERYLRLKTKTNKYLMKDLKKMRGINLSILIFSILLNVDLKPLQNKFRPYLRIKKAFTIKILPEILNMENKLAKYQADIKRPKTYKELIWLMGIFDVWFSYEIPIKDAMIKLYRGNKIGKIWKLYRQQLHNNGEKPGYISRENIRKMIKYIQDGQIIYILNKHDKQSEKYNLKNITKLKSLARMIKASAYNHRCARTIEAKSFEKKVADNTPMHMNSNNIRIPDKLKKYVIETKGQMAKAGKECMTCIAAYSNSKNYLFLRKENICAQVDQNGAIRQCLDIKNRTTKNSKNFRRLIYSAFAENKKQKNRSLK